MKKVFLGILYWLVQLTWGAFLTIPGLIITAFCIVFLKGKPHRNGFSYIVEIGGNWGGVCIGATAMCGKYAQEGSSCYNPGWFEHTRRHEFGHSVQQLVLGPFQLFLVDIASVIRYWYQRKRTEKGLSNTPYDQAIFEYTASKYGYYWINKIENASLEYTFKRK